VQNLLLSNTNQTAIGVINRPGPTLDLNFAATKNCIDQVSGRDLITFTRSTTGTYFDSAGILRSAAVNLVLQSEDFSTTWTTSLSTVTANATTSPDGRTTADGLLATGAGGSVLQTSQSFTAGSTITYSVFAKKNSSNFLRFEIGNLVSCWWDLNTGTTASNTAGSGNVLFSSKSIQSVGNGWYRCVLTVTTNIITTIFLNNYPTNSDGSSSSINSSIFLWGAQLETGSVATDYIYTSATVNSAPRFDHNPTTLESLGLLIEEPRTNFLQRSEEFDTLWSVFRSSVSANATVAPNNSTTADKLVEDTTATNTHGIQQSSISFTAGTSYTFSVYVKAAERANIRLTMPIAAFSSTLAAQFNLALGTTTTASSGVTATITELQNNWYRCTMSAAATTTASGSLTLEMGETSTSTTVTYSGNGTSGLFLWGAQLEAGSFATSYILNVNTPAGVTRAADVAEITGTNFSVWYRQDEGTLFTEFRDPGVSGTNRTPSVISDGTLSNRIQCFLSGTTTVNNRHISAGTAANPGTLSAIANSRNRHAIAAAVGSCNAASNGTLATASAPAAMPVVNRLNIGRNADSTGDYLNATIARITYYPVRISNAILQAITI
jgi:hypothetical protein